MKYIAFLIVLLFPFLAFARDELNPVEGGRIETLEKGEEAPFGGLLLDEMAIAQIIAEKQSLTEMLELEKQTCKRVSEAQIENEKRLHEIDLEFEKEKNRAMTEAMQTEIDGLAKEMEIYQETLQDEQDDDIWWAIGGAAGGATLAGLIAAVVVISM